MQANKNAFLFVLDRTNGKPVWPIEERPVPQSTVAGERTSPTQPFPTKPPAFDRQGVSDADLIDYTPELKARAREIAKDFVLGPMFTPPSITTEEPGTNRGTLMLPGSWGAANWNTGAFDPETGMYYALSASLPGPSNRAIKKQTERGRDHGLRQRGHLPGYRGAADHQGAVRTDHGVRSQHGHPGVDGRQRRRPAQSPVAEGAQPAAARDSEPSGAAAHQDAAVPRRRQQRRASARRRRTGAGARSSAPTTRRRAR